MTRVTKKKKREIAGARSSIVEDQPSFADDESRRGKHFTGGRKVIALDHVGAQTPDADPEPGSKRHRRLGSASRALTIASR